MITDKQNNKSLITIKININVRLISMILEVSNIKLQQLAFSSLPTVNKYGFSTL